MEKTIGYNYLSREKIKKIRKTIVFIRKTCYFNSKGNKINNWE